MSRHLDQVLAHAENQLAATGAKRPTEVLPLYKRFLKIEEHRLRLKHQAGGGGREICARRVDLVDVLLRHVFAAATTAVRPANSRPAAPLSLIAIGGYGRRELNPFSDVDVMILHGSGKIDGYTQEVVEQILYLLWDIGFKVGHSTRSVREALTQANTDMLTKTAMLESRYLAGDEDLAREFREQFRAKCVVGHEREYVEMRMADQAARHTKFGDSVYMQEPHIKNGCGGLRDYQNLVWITYFKEGALTTTHLVGKDWLSKADQRRIEDAYDFLLRLRTDLHYATGRATDTLHLNMQEQIATRLGYEGETAQLRSEIFMRDYYDHTRNIFRVSERLTQQFYAGQATDRTRSLFSFLPLVRSDEQKIEAFFVRNGQLWTRGRDLFEREPTQMIRVFQIAQEHHLALSPELEDRISRQVGRITKVFQYARKPRQMFLSILSRKGEVARILRMMHGVDVLGRYLPEFGQLTCLVQHEFFHRYTADEHTLVCIDKLDALMKTDDRKLMAYRKLFEQLDDPVVLYLALLLHDSGRGIRARPHSEASALFADRVATRLQLSRDQRKSLVLLVDHHVTMSNIAQQRNLDDPTTIAEFANIIKSQRNLNALMLLTLADGQGTGAAAWSDWKELLVWQLFHATTQYLADQKSYHEQTRIERDRLKTSVLQTLGPDYKNEIEAHFDFMPDHYFRATKLAEMIAHVKLFRSFFAKATSGDEPLSPALSWEAFPDQGHTIISICTWDRDRLLAKCAGAAAVAAMNILSVDTFDRDDHSVLLVLRVCDAKARAVTDPDTWTLFEETLVTALQNQSFDFKPLLDKARRQTRRRTVHQIEFPSSIVIDNKSHSSYTLVEIQAPDRIGLLYDVVSSICREGVTIAVSRISTQNGAAIDTFYVNDGTTRNKVTDSARLASMEKALRALAVDEK